MAEEVVVILDRGEIEEAAVVACQCEVVGAVEVLVRVARGRRAGRRLAPPTWRRVERPPAAHTKELRPHSSKRPHSREEVVLHMVALVDHRNADDLMAREEVAGHHRADTSKPSSRTALHNSPMAMDHHHTLVTSHMNHHKRIPTLNPHTITVQVHIRATIIPRPPQHRPRATTPVATAPGDTAIPLVAKVATKTMLMAGAREEQATRATARARRRTAAPRPPTTRIRNPPTTPTSNHSRNIPTTMVAVGDLLN